MQIGEETAMTTNLLASGCLFQIGGTAITWKSKKQACVALSTAEVEYMALSGAAHPGSHLDARAEL